MLSIPSSLSHIECRQLERSAQDPLWFHSDVHLTPVEEKGTSGLRYNFGNHVLQGHNFIYSAVSINSFKRSAICIYPLEVHEIWPSPGLFMSVAPNVALLELLELLNCTKSNLKLRETGNRVSGARLFKNYRTLL